MIRLARSPFVVLVLLVVAALVAACSPSVGALGTPATPGPTPDQSVPVASDDATPDLSSPAPIEPSVEPSSDPSGEPGGSPSSSPSATPAPTATPRPTTASTGTTIVRAYFILGSFTGNEGLVPVLREPPQTKAVATAAMRALLDGPAPMEMAASPAMYTAIPDGTTLLGLTIKDGIATVDLSKEFESGGGGDTMRQRLGQVVYTLTQFPTVDGVRFELDGVPTSTFGGEGITFTPAGRPIVRKDFHDQLPAIFIDRPAWGASLGNLSNFSGLANVFEATFRIELRDAAGSILEQRKRTASCGTGCWGTWTAAILYSVTKAQWGTVRVYSLSAKDGSVENLTEYPVWLTPGS